MEQNKQKKKLYQKWWVWVIGLILIVFIWVQGSYRLDKALTKDIPNVMSINYTDAEKVLKENGFKVTSVETDAGSILSNDKYYNRSVKAGEVFKINDETNPDYYETTKNKKVTIYYAKEDYTYEKSAENTPSPNTAQTSEKSSSGSAEWKQFLKDYEEWVDRYIEFMKKYKDNPSDVSLISEYTKFISETAEWAEKTSQYENKLKEMSSDDLNEYMKAIGRILEKINSIA